jgi:hypothetical protein
MWFGESLLASFVCISELAPVQQRLIKLISGFSSGKMSRIRHKRKGSHILGKVRSEWIG